MIRRPDPAPRRRAAAAAGAPSRPSAYAQALRMLALRELSTAQLVERLRDRQVPAAEIDDAVERLRRDGALDDRRFAAAYARSAVQARHRGRIRVLRELSALGIDAATARQVTGEVFGDVDEGALLERALARRLRGPLVDAAHFRRLYQYLVRQGFPPEAAVRALRARGGARFGE